MQIALTTAQDLHELHQNQVPSMTQTHDMNQLANAVRFLAIDAVDAANSGHPGLPMGMADTASVLFTRHLRFDPRNPEWPNRDRFVLSAGHGSMLIYALLYLTGTEGIGLDDLKQFRKLHSKTPGHPEFGETPGVETTTGPLGQGIATAVGMALSEEMARARFGADLVSHHTYVIAGDGCLMEGISQEAISFAGHQKLSRLIVLFDDNGISIDGPTNKATSEDHLARFRACGWDVEAVDGHDAEAVDAAITRAKASPNPSMIACKTTIGFGSPAKAGTAGAHGAPLGDEEAARTRNALGWPHGRFEIPDNILKSWRDLGARHQQDAENWAAILSQSDQATQFERFRAMEFSEEAQQALAEHCRILADERPKMATRVASQKVLEVLNPLLPFVVGGSADLTGSNNTKTEAMDAVTPSDRLGRYVHYGVREHGMAAIMNGMALHGFFSPYGGTFLVFTDYCRPAIRLSALMDQRVIYVMTHDSIGLGEDGPTHQPIEHLAALRAMPNLLVFRPADAVETAEAWHHALTHEGPSILCLTRQGLPTMRQDVANNKSAEGAYILKEAQAPHQATLMASGSEVAIMMEAAQKLEDQNVGTRVLSMPCMELISMERQEFREKLVGPAVAVVAMEAASSWGWERYVGDQGAILGIDSFGASAAYQDLYEYFGLTANQAVAEVMRQLAP